MLAENIKILRKQKGYSQETLSQELNVVRQTVSKWEKGYSVPDAEMLKKIAELFEVPVSTLLGTTIPDEKPDAMATDEVAKQLAILNEQLANMASRRRRIWKRVIIGGLAGLLLLFIMYVGCFILFKAQKRADSTFTRTTLECTLDGETYTYELIYDQNFSIYEEGGDAWIYEHAIGGRNYENARVVIAQIEDYIIGRGGEIVLSAEENYSY